MDSIQVTCNGSGRGQLLPLRVAMGGGEPWPNMSWARAELDLSQGGARSGGGVRDGNNAMKQAVSNQGAGPGNGDKVYPTVGFREQHHRWEDSCIV